MYDILSSSHSICLCPSMSFPLYLPLRQIKRSDGRLSKVQERVALRQLTSLLTRLDQSLPQFSVREVRRLLGSRERLERLHERGREELWAEFGFCLEVCESRLVGGGRGVAISQGKVPTGHLVALYPGTYVRSWVFGVQSVIWSTIASISVKQIMYH